MASPPNTPPPQKKARFYTYTFKAEWEENYFFTSFEGNPICLICRGSVASSKKCNLQRHYNQVHTTHAAKYPLGSSVRKLRVEELKKALGAEQAHFKKPGSTSKVATIASLKVTHLLAKKKKPFEDGALVKEATLLVAETLFQDAKYYPQIKSAISDIQLSANTVARRTEMLSADVSTQLATDLEKCVFLSLQLDESTDIEDTAQLSIFLRMVFNDNTVKEDFLAVLPLTGKTRGEDIYKAFKACVTEKNVPLHKLVAITTDGAPSMVGRNVGFVSICKRDPDFPAFSSYHCIIHQQALCSKVLDYKHVMSIVVRIVNSIRARSLQHRLFKALLDEMEVQYGGLLLHTDVRWLSRGKVLQRFLDVLPEISVFLQGRGEHVQQLSDPRWLCDLAFLNDLTAKLNMLNVELQGENKTVTELIGSVNSFKVKLALWKTQMENGNLQQFPSLQKIENVNAVCVKEVYSQHLDTIRQDFEKRFSDFSVLEPVASFVANPFKPLDISDTAAEIAAAFGLCVPDLELELANLQGDLALKARAFSHDFWALVEKCRYPLLRETSQRLLACFGSTYLCESAFSAMKFLKSKYRSRLTNAHLNDCLKLAVTNYTPSFGKLADSMQCQVSH